MYISHIFCIVVCLIFQRSYMLLSVYNRPPCHYMLFSLLYIKLAFVKSVSRLQICHLFCLRYLPLPLHFVLSLVHFSSMTLNFYKVKRLSKFFILLDYLYFFTHQVLFLLLKFFLNLDMERLGTRFNSLYKIFPHLL